MHSRSRLWHVLNAGLHSTPIDAAGEKRARIESDEQTPPADSGESEERDERDERDDFTPEDLALLGANMRVNTVFTTTWEQEHRDFSHNFEHDKVPLVRYDRDWDIQEFYLTDETPLEVELSGTLDDILTDFQNGASGAPPAFDLKHFNIHLAACQAAMYKRPELMDNINSTVHKFIREDGSLFIKFIFVYNAVSEETGRDPIVYASDLNAMGLTDLEIYRLWHQIRHILSHLMESKATLQGVSDGMQQIELAGFMHRILREVDPRNRVLPFSSQPMEW